MLLFVYLIARYITPEIYLSRGPNKTMRLEELLQQAASKGVAVRILAWNESKVWFCLLLVMALVMVMVYW